MEEKIENGAVKTQSAYAHKQPEIKITKGFTAKKIDDPSKISLSNVTLVEKSYGGEYPQLDEHSWENSAKMVIASCRPNRNDEQGK